MLISKIISGAQTGADIAGLKWAKANGLVTGGHIPKGFRTNEGPRPEYALMYDIKETQDTGYPLRTRMNVMCGDGTLLFGNTNSPGCKLTIKYCMDYRKPFYIAEWPYKNKPNESVRKHFREWLDEYNIQCLNIAGNREKFNPGIEQALYEFLDFVFKD
jgi:hypothetical protein